MRHKRRRGVVGQSLVEFALVFPILILMLVAVFDIGRGVFAYNSITNAAREGARLAIVNQSVSSIQARANSQAPMAEQAAANVTVRFLDAGPDGQPTSTACNPIEIDCFAEVTYTTRFSPVTPIISTLLFPGGVDLTAQSIEAIEFVCPIAPAAASTCPKQP